MDGAIVGTVPYMAPEQLEGRESDARTDVFALGTVLYEMVTGRRAFEGGSSASVIAAILTAEPPGITTSSPLAPPALERAVARCIAKDPDKRWQSARDLALELSWIAGAGADADTSGSASAPKRTGERLAWAAAVGALAIALGWFLFHAPDRERVRQPARFKVAPPEGRSLDVVRIAPDGRHLSFTSTTAEGVSQIWLRPLDSVTIRALPGTEGASWHVWSPDSRHIAFLANRHLKRIDITGGTPRTVCPAPGSGPFGLPAWSPDGTILFRVDEAPGQRQGLFRVPADGGDAVPLDFVDESGAPLEVGWPSFLPDGRRFLCTCMAKEAPANAVFPGGVNMCLASLDTGRARRVHDVPSYAEYVPSGHVVYSEASSLFAQPLDLGTLRVHGEPLRIADGLNSWNGVGPPEFSLSSNGVLVYQPVSGQSRLTWKDRTGRELGHVGEPGIYEDVRLAPDGRRAAVMKGDPRLGTSDVWIVELDRNVATRFTSEADTGIPVWAADGKQIAYCSPRDAPPSLYLKRLGGGAEEVLLPSNGSLQCPADWSPDGRVLLFMERHASTGLDLWTLDLGSRAAAPLLRTPSRETQPRFSPDGRWIAYVSDESGRPEVYLQAFPGPGDRLRVSVDGGRLPRWRRDGRELFYKGAGERLMAVPIELGSMSIGAPVPLFGLGSSDFDASAGGNRFLVVVPEPGATSGATVVLDWDAELASRRR
jgi:Tol biopolymer transport system component